MIRKRINFCVKAVILASFATVFTACEPKEEAQVHSGFRPVGSESYIMEPALWGELNTHDPSIFKDGDTYYVFSTDASYGDIHKPGVQIRKSNDLVTWEYVGVAFKDFEEECAEPIEHAKLNVAAKNGLWAPDIIKVGKKYRLYFSASTFGSSRSCIALAEADNIEGPYKYKGIVVKSNEGASTGPNCIDPAIAYGRDGSMYMTYGSFSGGIFITELNEETGFLKNKLETPQKIAGSRSASVEGPYIIYSEETDYFYLFVSYGSLSSDYNIRVGRSRDITGPYLDANDRDMATLGLGNEERIGVKIMGGHTFVSNQESAKSKGVMAPGHNSVLVDGDEYFLVHHTRTYTLPDYWFLMNVRRVFMNRFGWPVSAPLRYYGEPIEAVDFEEGDYGLIEHLTDSNFESHSSVVVNMSGGVISGAAEGSYKLYDDYRIEIIINDILYDGVVLRQFDEERQADVITFTAMSEDGLCIWGCTQI